MKPVFLGFETQLKFIKFGHRKSQLLSRIIVKSLVDFFLIILTGMGGTDLQTVGIGWDIQVRKHSYIGWDIQVRKHNYEVVFDLQLL